MLLRIMIMIIMRRSQTLKSNLFSQILCYANIMLYNLTSCTYALKYYYSPLLPLDISSFNGALNVKITHHSVLICYYN